MAKDPQQQEQQKEAMEQPRKHSSSPLESLILGRFEDDANFHQGLQNLNSLPDLAAARKKYLPGKPFKRAGVMGFRRNGKNLNLTIACEKAMVRQIELSKFIAMVENMHDEEAATIVLENFIEPDENRQPRGQILGRLNGNYSCITIAQGLTGRVIHGVGDVVRFDAYYLDKGLLTAFYIAAKAQQGVKEELDELISAFEGWKAFEIPLDPYQPHN